MFFKNKKHVNKPNFLGLKIGPKASKEKEFEIDLCKNRGGISLKMNFKLTSAHYFSTPYKSVNYLKCTPNTRNVNIKEYIHQVFNL